MNAYLAFWRSPDKNADDDYQTDPRLEDTLRQIRLAKAEGRAAYWTAEADRLRAKIK